MYLLNQYGKSAWYELSDAQRVAFERAVTAIMAYYQGQRLPVLALITEAVDRSPLNRTVIAVLWRLREEISND